jgi:hypothetical protein
MMRRDERWPVARLIPIASATGVDARERNAPSALLAVFSVVGVRPVTAEPLGAPAGKFEAVNEVPFKQALVTAAHPPHVPAGQTDTFEKASEQKELCAQRLAT